MQSHLKPTFLLLLLLLAPIARGAATYLTQQDIAALVATLPPPPAPDSPQQKTELTEIHDLQAKRSPIDIARCKSEVNATAFIFHDTLGDWFSADQLPRTAALMKDVYDQTRLVSDQAKAIYPRKRPPLVDSEVHPCVFLEKSNSYPSGHATRGVVWATILSTIFPDEKSRLMDRGLLFGRDRVTAGVHFPSDVEAGQALGAKIAEKLLASPAFRDALDRAREECLADISALPDH